MPILAEADVNARYRVNGGDRFRMLMRDHGISLLVRMVSGASWFAYRGLGMYVSVLSRARI